MEIIQLLQYIFIIAVGVQIIMFVPAYLFKTDVFTDLSYSLTFIIITTMAGIIGGFSFPTIMLGILLYVWAIRLGSYLFIRIRRIKKDARFDGMREDPISFLRFWLLQGIAVFIIMIPSSVFLIQSEQVFGLQFIIGWCVSLFGIVFEAIADYQKYVFINNPENKGLWISSGVWKISRHPNYFGEILVWVGIYIAVVPSFSFLWIVIGFTSPLFIILLLRFGSGVPLLEKSADEKWGNNPQYQEYKLKTPVLVPKIF